MVIDVKKLKYSGKDRCSFHFEYDADSSVINLPNAKFDGAVTVTGTLTLGGNEVFVDGEIGYSILGECSRCLESVIFHNVIDFNEVYTQEIDEEDETYRYSKGLVDLTEMVNEKLMLFMPYQILCKDDCKGLCPKCGANLNKTTCECAK